MKTVAHPYSEYFGVEATGQRIGLMICKVCGATVMLGDKDCDAAFIHAEWHKKDERRSIA